jgi:hypothetical protein
MSKALPQDAVGNGNCATIGTGATEDWDCLVPANTITPAIKAVPAMVEFNGNLYMARNACSAASVQTLTTTQTNTCKTTGGDGPVPQLWRLPANCGTAAACAAAWVPAAQRGPLTMNANTNVYKTDFNGLNALGAGNTEITLLVKNGNRLIIGFDNGTSGINIWRSKSGVTNPVNESDFEPICAPTDSLGAANACNNASMQFGFGAASTYTRIFYGTAINDAGTDYTIFTAGNGTNTVRVFRAINQ